MAVAEVDGMDPEAVYLAMQQAVARGRKESAPSFLELRAYRYKGHHTAEKEYRDPVELETWWAKDPLETWPARLMEEGFLSLEDKLMRLYGNSEKMTGLLQKVGMEADEDILANAMALGGTSFHICGTCRMGADETSVVDPQLRVRGVTGLRVVDTSIMPTIVSGNTNAPAMAIALNAADMILRPRQETMP